MAGMASTTVGMRELHLFTRSVLETVRQVGGVIVTDRGRPVARIVAIPDDEAAVIEAGGTVPARSRFTVPTRTVPEGGPSATDVLLAMREDERS